MTPPDQTLADQLAILTKERDEALDRVEELEGAQEILSADFEKDCWIAVRSLLLFVGHTDFSEGVTAQDACEIIADAIRDERRRAQAAEGDAKHHHDNWYDEVQRRFDAEAQRDALAKRVRIGWHYAMSPESYSLEERQFVIASLDISKALAADQTEGSGEK